MKALAAVLLLLPAVSLAQKSAVGTTDLSLVPAISSFQNGNYVGVWTDVITTGLHTSQLKDLAIGASLEVGLFTDTLVSSQKGTRDTSSAEAQVQVRVIIDKGTPNERIADPGVVTFSRRKQDLIATFGGILQQCTDADRNFTITIDECTFEDETLQLILETLSAHAFFFFLDDLGSGTHTVTVQSRISTGVYSEAGSANARAWVGKGSVSVEEVRLAKGVNINL